MKRAQHVTLLYWCLCFITPTSVLCFLSSLDFWQHIFNIVSSEFPCLMIYNRKRAIENFKMNSCVKYVKYGLFFFHVSWTVLQHRTPYCIVICWFIYSRYLLYVSGKMFVRAWLQLIRRPSLGVSRRFVFFRSLLILKQKL